MAVEPFGKLLLYSLRLVVPGEVPEPLTGLAQLGPELVQALVVSHQPESGATRPAGAAAESRSHAAC